MVKKNNYAIGYAAVAFSGVLFGCIPLLTRLIHEEGIATSMTVLLRFLIVIPISAVICAVNGEHILNIRPKDILHIAVMTVIGAVCSSVLLYTSYAYINTGVATTIYFCYPMFVLLIGILFFRENLKKRTIVSFAVFLVGLVLLYDFTAGFSFWGMSLSLAAGLCYGIYIAYLDKSRVLVRVSLNVYVFWYNVFATLASIPYALARGELSFAAFTWHGWVYVILFAILVGCLGTRLFQYGVGKIGGNSASLLSTLEPITSIIVGALFLNEPLTVKSGLGSAVVLCAVLILVLPRSKQINSNS